MAKRKLNYTRCEKHGINNSTSHRQICDQIPPPDELLEHAKETGITYAGDKFGVSYQTVRRLLCAVYGEDEIKKMTGVFTYKPKPKKLDTRLKCIECKILLTADKGSGMLCGTCYSGTHDTRPEKSIIGSSSVASSLW